VKAGTMNNYKNAIKGLHHNAYRCRDSEETRKFYEDVLGLRLASAIEFTANKTGLAAPTKALHSFFELGDHSFLAFFELPGDPDERLFQERSDLDLHIALEVPDPARLAGYKQRAIDAGADARGPVDHGFVHSLYLRDPNGYVVELTTKMPTYDKFMDGELTKARQVLDRWQVTKHDPPAAKSG
jgi:catechol 2,3-dioxygenase-like lactoylglutathione lyase family enzyme